MQTFNRGDWIETYTGKKLYPLDIKPEDLDIRDIAHGLSQLCRFGGQCKKFYSVAEHSIRISFLCRPEDAIAALIHDGSEACGWVDLPRPVKYSPGLEEYRRLEHIAQSQVFRGFGLDLDEKPESVQIAENKLVWNEKKDLLTWDDPDLTWGMGNRSTPYENYKIEPYDMLVAERLFLDRWFQLTMGRAFIYSK